jgi:choline dehydrogenase
MRLNPMYQAFIDAGKEAGYPVTLDYNGYQQEGFGPMHMTVNAGVRASTANAYLRPAMKRENLRLVVDTTVHRVLVKDRRAVGIEYMKDGQMFSIRARKEVILSAGSIGSPILLQRSGLGPRQVLHDAGVECIEDLRGVGENLQDHLEVYFQYQCLRPISLNGKLGLIEKAKIGARWLLLRSGLGATNQFESCGFIRSRAGVEWPDIQYHFFPGAMRYDGRAAFEGHGFQVHVGPNRPASRGRVQIRSANSSAAPSILFNYLSEEKDRDNFRQCIRLSREVLTQSALSKYRGAEIQPGLDVTSNIDIDAWVRQNCESAYHPSCTCKMGAQDDPLAVLDSECRVRKIDGLRIVDSSIFPAITNGNLNAPTIMAAERAADMIRGRDLLPSANAPVWIDPHWQTRQRFGETPDSR